MIALAHEWGHHIQNWMDVPFPRTAAESVNYENQADCIAGSFARYAGDQGWLESDDLDDVETLLANIGSDGAGRDHGTSAERAAAFQLGDDSGIKGCNSFSPNAKLA